MRSLLLLLSLTVLAMNTRSGVATEPPEVLHTSPSVAAPSALTLDLAGCLHLALERQPRVAVQRASLAAAEDGKRALEALRIPAFLDHELPIRRRQADLGVAAAAAGLDEVERQTAYAVTRTYLTVQYARAQERVADGIVARLSTTYEAARQQLEGGARDVTSTDVNRAKVYLHLTKTRQLQATQGVERALAALKEAIGLEPDVQLDVPPVPLPEPQVQLHREDVVAWALARRGDLVRVTLFAEVVCLEVEAQGTSLLRKKETFAAGSDIHAVAVPQEVKNSEYRPGAVPPEMPTLLAGSRPERVKHAQSLHARATAAVETTRNLIALEAADAFLRWQEAALQVPQAREAATTGDQLAGDLSKDFAARLKVRVEDVVNANVLASQARSQYNEYLYHQLLALADLERITAGGFCAGLAAAPGDRPQPVLPESGAPR